MSTWRYKYLFGPVLSRRLGRSLGVDLVPFKTCTYDCIYCEQGRTTNHTMERREYVRTEDVLEEVGDFLSFHPAPDFVTLSGAGEPTLHAGLAQLIQGIKSLTRIPLAVITNGSLLWDGKVRDALHDADIVLPSLDAGSAELFRYIDRPVPGISFEQMVTGLIAFRMSFQNEIWLEVLLLSGITSGESEVREIAEWARRIRPDRIQLNTVARPPAESFALPTTPEQLERLAELFDPRAMVIAEPPAFGMQLGASPDAVRVLELLERRPCPPAEIAAALELRPVEVSKLIERLLAEHRVIEKSLGTSRFYTTVHDISQETTQ